jgi:hypothetical protein
LLAATWIAAFVVLPGCAGRKPPAWPVTEAPSVASIKAALAERSAPVRALRLRGTGEFTGRDGARRFQLQTAVEPPHHLRLFAAVGSFASLFTLIVREDGFGLHLPLRKEVLVAKPDEQIAFEGGELPVAPSAVWPVFMPDRLIERVPDDAALAEEGSVSRLVWTSDSGHEEIDVSSEVGGIVRYIGASPAGDTLEIVYDAYGWRDGLWYPGRTTILLPGFEARIVVDVTSLDLNPALSPRTFELRFPADATIRHIGKTGPH